MNELISTWFHESALWLLFSSGFLSATLLPGASEATLVAALTSEQYFISTVILVSTLGNTLGGMTNYLLGLWLPERTSTTKHGHKATAWLKKHGYPVLLLSWLPVIGDLLCLAAGWLRLSFLPCLLLVTIGKALRYSLLAALYIGIF